MATASCLTRSERPEQTARLIRSGQHPRPVIHLVGACSPAEKGNELLKPRFRHVTWYETKATMDKTSDGPPSCKHPTGPPMALRLSSKVERGRTEDMGARWASGPGDFATDTLGLCGCSVSCIWDELIVTVSPVERFLLASIAGEAASSWRLTSASPGA